MPLGPLSSSSSETSGEEYSLSSEEALSANAASPGLAARRGQWVGAPGLFSW